MVSGLATSRCVMYSFTFTQRFILRACSECAVRLSAADGNVSDVHYLMESKWGKLLPFRALLCTRSYCPLSISDPKGRNSVRPSVLPLSIFHDETAAAAVSEDSEDGKNMSKNRYRWMRKGAAKEPWIGLKGCVSRTSKFPRFSDQNRSTFPALP